MLYWDKKNAVAQKSYKEFNPIEKITEWDTPILIIHGGKDYRVPEEQGFQAFTAAQLRGIKSELLYFPDENHWVLQPQNGSYGRGRFQMAKRNIIKLKGGYHNRVASFFYILEESFY